MRHVTVGLYMPSAMIASGLSAIVAGVTDVSVSCHDMWGKDLVREIKVKKPSLLFVDPIAMDNELMEAVKGEADNRMVMVGVYVSALPAEISQLYDEMVSIYDSPDAVASLLRRIASKEEPSQRARELSPRERTVVVGVVKGLSNKEIAEEMHVSVNTVMTHRRNIASKLQIHSAAGLTIYAIVSKLVRLDDVKAGFTAL
ncbi:MAG: LuxR C-terminal-related transcriptional regulator [Muribaculaceae bacterium]|nr:LuxR C-terminal-related transcriptional regulator [Muribaculaceae bacterium]